MAKVRYNGRDDVRVLAAADLAKAGVEGFTKREFPQGQVVEVDDAVAKALIEDDQELFGGFEAADEAERDASTSDEGAPETGAAQESTGTSPNKTKR